MPWNLLQWCCCWLPQDTDAAQLEPAAAKAAAGVPPANRHEAAAVLTGQTARRKHIGNSMPPLPGMHRRLHARLSIASVRCASINFVCSNAEAANTIHACLFHCI